MDNLININGTIININNPSKYLLKYGQYIRNQKMSCPFALKSGYNNIYIIQKPN